MALVPLTVALLLAVGLGGLDEAFANQRATARAIGKARSLRVQPARRSRPSIQSRHISGRRSVVRPLRTRAVKASSPQLRVRPVAAKPTRPQRTSPAPKNLQTAPKARRFEKPLKAVQAGFAKFKSKPAVAGAIKFYKKTRASITRTLDRWQSRAPPWLAKTMSGFRTYTLSSIAAYSFSKVKKDKLFLGSFFAANSVVSNVILPAAIVVGMDPVLSGVLNALTTPATLGVVVLRERHLRRKAGEDIGLGDTATLIKNEYRAFAKERRQSAAAEAYALTSAAPAR